MKKISPVLSLILILAGLFTACSSEKSDPKLVGRKFLEAMIQKDFKTAKEYCTTKTQGIISVVESTPAAVQIKGDISSLKIGEFTQTGSSGKLAFTYENNPLELTMTESGGTWLVDVSTDFVTALGVSDMKGVGKILGKTVQEAAKGFGEAVEGFFEGLGDTTKKDSAK